MKIDYNLCWIEKTDTPSMYRAMVCHEASPGFLDLLLGRKGYKCDVEYIGNETWYEVGSRKRADKILEHFLSECRNYTDKKEENGPWLLPMGIYTFK